jgi:hypothetical protein
MVTNQNPAWCPDGQRRAFDRVCRMTPPSLLLIFTVVLDLWAGLFGSGCDSDGTLGRQRTLLGAAIALSAGT